MLRKAQFLPAVRGAKLMGFLDGTILEPLDTLEEGNGNAKKTINNPEYDAWVAKDQHVLSYLLNSLTKDALASVAMATMSAEASKVIEEMFLAQSKARAMNLRMQLATFKKGNLNLFQ